MQEVNFEKAEQMLEHTEGMSAGMLRKELSDFVREFKHIDTKNLDFRRARASISDGLRRTEYTITGVDTLSTIATRDKSSERNCFVRFNFVPNLDEEDGILGQVIREDYSSGRKTESSYNFSSLEDLHVEDFEQLLLALEHISQTSEQN